MELPNDSIGPTDLLAYRGCPRRASYGMRRHIGPGEQSDELTPEAGSWAADYGKAIHAMVRALDDGESIDDALATAWDLHGASLMPNDVQALLDDAQTYLDRDFPNTRTVLNEEEIRVPLMRHKGRQYYFRTRIDRLLERLDQPGTFIHVDYKSERHPKSAAEVRDDLQLWMTNWAIHEFLPEVDELVQVYDQLKFGQQRTRKNAEARKRIKEWIVREATRVIEDEGWREDGLLKPQLNKWCAWCPILESCPVIPQLTDWSKTRIASLGPITQEGRRREMQLDPSKLDEYAELFAQAKEAKRILDRFEKAARELLVELPEAERSRLGYDLRDRKERTFTSDGLRAMHRQLGDRFYELAKVTKTSLETELADTPELLSFALGLAEEAIGSEVLVAAQ